MPMAKRLLFTIKCLVALTLATCAAQAANPFRNLTNEPFATRCNGPQGAIVIPQDAVGTSQQARVSALQTQGAQSHVAHAAATLRRLQRAGVVGAGTWAGSSRLAVHTQGGRLVLPDLVRSMAVGDLGDEGNQITFQYENWTAPEQTLLETYIANAYPKARLIYGPPAFNITVKVIRDDTVTDLQGGFYDATANEIRMPSLSGNVPEDTFIFMMLVLRAFHDDVAFFYDAWEEGFVGAAATAIQVQPGVSGDFDPKDPGPFYALSVYEAVNHPELGNPTFYPAGDFGGMLVWRVAMARAAWLKAWIEDGSFFANFNRQYYAQFTSELPGDVLGLRSVASAVLPSVEGLPFQEWYQRQYVLDTSVRSGIKEYTWDIPLESAVVLIVEHYLTDGSGDEFIRGGQARTIYWSYDFAVNLYAEEGNLIDIPTTGDTPGEGFLIPTFFNIGGPQRVMVQLDLNGLRSFYPYPYGIRGFEVGENNLYGGIIGETTGTIDVEGGDGISGLNVGRAVWGDEITSFELSPLQLKITFTNPDGQTMVRQVNVGWDSYCVFLDGSSQTTLTHTFAKGTTGLQLISLPLTPALGSAPDVFGIASADLLLARWDPAAPPDGKYEIWPNCDPLATGRGFWLRTFEDVTASITGVKAAEEQRISVPIELGWNMVGSPRLSNVPVPQLKVQVGTDTPVLLADAVDKHWVQAGIFGYGQSTGYLTLDELVPFDGYWIRCLVPAGAWLVFEPVGSTASAGQSAPQSLPKPDWVLPVHVQAGSLYSHAAYIGAAGDATDGFDPAYDMQAPPAFGPAVTARFVREEAGSKQVWLSDVRAANARRQTWDLEVTSTVADTPVRLTWPDLTSVPGELKPILVDRETGKRLYMRTSPGYTIPASDSGATRQLRIVMAADSAATLTVSSMAARPDRSGVSLSYTLSQTASVTARVLNIAGRPIRVLASGVVQPAGSGTQVWNLSDQRGTRVPSGLYLFEIEARSDDGQVVRAVRSARVTR